MANAAPADLASLPAAYRAWRASDLGRITDRIEEELILTLTAPVAVKKVLDVGRGDGVLSVTLARQGANVTGVDDDRSMLEPHAIVRAAHTPTLPTLKEMHAHCRSRTAPSMSWWRSPSYALFPTRAAR
jgi:SAM-dependent methyltransferase